MSVQHLIKLSPTCIDVWWKPNILKQQSKNNNKTPLWEQYNTILVNSHHFWSTHPIYEIKKDYSEGGLWYKYI